MIQAELQQLLSRYEAAETTLAEEQALRDYFARPDVPQELSAERDYFRALSQMTGAEDAPAADITRLEGMISAWEQTAHAADGPRRTRWLRLWPWVGTAAAAASVTIWLFVRRQPAAPPDTASIAELRDTYDDPNQAAAEAERAMQLFSENLNEGLAMIEKL